MAKYSYRQMTLEQALKEYPECADLIEGEGSAMSESISDEEFFIPHRKIRVQLCLHSNSPVAWSWISPYRYPKEGKYLRMFSFMVYVKPGHRFRGIASKLLKDAKEFSQKRHRRFVVHPWDPGSEKFYCAILSKNKLDYFEMIRDGK